MSLASPVPLPELVECPTTILVVEDEELIRLLVAEYLQDSGYCVLEASDVAEAKAALSADISVDVVFSDVNMPGAEDGFVLANWIHQHRPDTKVLLTSGFPHGNEKTRELCEPLLAKPYSPLSMLRRIQSLLERR